MGLNAAILVLGPSGLATACKVQAAIPDAQVHGFAPRVEAAVTFTDTVAHLREQFAAHRPIVAICSAGIVIRALAPVLSDKRVEPPVLAVAEDGSSVVPLLGGHHGANDMARALADALSAHAAITSAGDVRLGVALDAPPAGYVLANPQDAKGVMAAILAGEAVRIDGRFPWLDGTPLIRDNDAKFTLRETIYAEPGDGETLIYHPRSLVVGVGCERGTPADLVIALARQVVADHALAPAAIAAVVSLEIKADEPAVHALASQFGVPARFVGAQAIDELPDPLPNPSEIVRAEVGVAGVAEGAALVGAGPDGKLIVEKTKGQRCTLAIALATAPVDGTTIGRARGRLSVVGLGPGTADWRSPEATALLAAATDWVGYDLYLDLAEDQSAGKTLHRFQLGEEEARVRHGLALAAEGRDVALLCSGDAGIYAMGALVFELLDPGTQGAGDAEHRVEVVMAPGVSAFQAAAARAGAPIGHDFCCISLSDLLTPWSVIEARLQAAAQGDFVVALYNPRSRRRQRQLDRAVEILAARRPAETPVVVAANLGRPAESITHTSLSELDCAAVDMLSLVLVGSSESRAFIGGDGRTRVYTPRGYAAKGTSA